MKLAKFALTCDGEKITSLDQLKEHFNLLDVLEHYKTNTLWRWLRSRGYQNELQGIEAITATQDTEILKALCEVFGIEADQQMIQEVLEDQKNMQEKEALKAELKTQHALVPLTESTKALVAHTPTLITHSTPSAPSFKDYLKSYTALKNKLFNAQDLESGKAVLRELIQDYAELLEMDKLNIAAVLHAEARLRPTKGLTDTSNRECDELAIFSPVMESLDDLLLDGDDGVSYEKPTIAPLLWMCFLVHFWGLEWADCVCQMHIDVNGQHELVLPYLRRHNENSFDYFTHFAQPKTLTIPAQGKVHVFDKVVCVRRQYTINGKDGGSFYDINPYDLETHLVIKDNAKQQNLLSFGFDEGFYLLKGAVEIRHRRSNETQSTTLSYLELDL
ncbi:hypothetical protein [Helicobacter bizzozeronii]|uniref:hypothetical protein n=1 Tax=Helicobacter bizzozeronii TaxID=56877 RepID=UPI000CF19F35|nr:hypothetical protein [Helicobacter bizzozeronii]